MRRSRNIAITGVVGFSVVLGLTASLAVGQTLPGQQDNRKKLEIQPPPPKLELPPPQPTPTLSVNVAHHVIGTLKRPHNCGTNTTVSVIESFYVPGDGQHPPTLVPAGNTLANLRPRTLGSAQANPNTGNFDVQWMEVNALDRMPWFTARHAQTGQNVIAYRVLTLHVVGGDYSSSTGSTIMAGFPQPEPIITFIGNETTKNVRTIQVTCIGQG